MIVEPERLAVLKPGPPGRGAFVLYWMQHAQRARENPALEYAAAEAARLDLPLAVLFVLASYPSATAVHYRFLLGGLAETARALEDRGARFVLRRGHPPKEAAGLSRNAALAVCDAGWTRPELAWRREFAERSACPVLRVDGEAVVPVEAASAKLEWSAFTLRRKIEGAVPAYSARIPPEVDLPRDARGLDLDVRADLLEDAAGPVPPAYPGDRVPEQTALPAPGTEAAMTRFGSFLETGLDRYDADRNDPNLDGTSGMSPYLHFGQVSPVRLARLVLERGGPGAAPFIEQLTVRRELSMNLVRHLPDGYDRWEGLPEWARRTLGDAAGDKRDYLYSRADFEAARTHDPYWNAAQNQLVRTGTIHNYMRMYWGKKILEWSADPREAYGTALYLNDRYALDGRDPDGYAGVAWCFGRHDRPWSGRAVFGTVRYMNAAGLRRKFDADAYAGTWA
mgnify:CR=1 FL=1